MPAYTDTLGFNKGVAGFDAKNPFAVSKLETTLDFAVIKAARAAAGATALAAADTLQVLQIPAKCQILAAGLEVVSVETVNTTATLDLGFTGGSPAAANVFADDAATNAATFAAVALAAPVTIGTTADTLDILLNTAVPQNAKVRVFAIVVNLG